MNNIAIPCSLYRGGTSRGLLLNEADFSFPLEIRDKVLLRMFGSPDRRQIDGVGGATSLTSKALIVGAETRPGADVRMTFAQVGVAAPVVDWGGNCGNMTSAVGPFAIEAGLVPPIEPITVVRIRSVNTGARVNAYVPVSNGHVLTEGDYSISGVPGSGARIDLEWLKPGGSTTGRLVPTGRPAERLNLSDGRSIEVSIVDAGNPIVFCKAESLGLHGTELPDELERRVDVMRTLEEIRAAAAELLGLVKNRSIATERSPGLPKVAFTARRQDFVSSVGERFTSDSHDLQARLLSMQTAHRTYAGAGAICTAVAAMLPGTVVNDCVGDDLKDRGSVRIAHPAGLMDVQVNLDRNHPELCVVSATVGRTARRILSGLAWIPECILTATAT